MLSCVLVLLAVVVRPVLGQGRGRSQLSVCQNNLRNIGQAILIYDSEHGEVDPWWYPRTSESTFFASDVWYWFGILSNELRTPKVLSCPTDARTMGLDFTGSMIGGFFSPAYRGLAVSYFVGLDSSVWAGDSILAGDRNVRYSYYATCSAKVTSVTIPALPAFRTGWTNGLHQLSGNILSHDGRVETYSSERLAERFVGPGPDRGVWHLLPP